MRVRFWTSLMVLGTALVLGAALTPALWGQGTWELADPGTANPNGVFFIDPLHGVVTATSSSGFVFGGLGGSPIRWSEDGGLTWQGALLEVDEEISSCQGPCFVEEQRGWCIGRLKEGNVPLLLASQDGGCTWQQQQLPELLKPRFIWFEPSGGQNGWLLSQNRLGRTQDSGKTWEERRFPPDLIGGVISVYVGDFQHLWVIGDHQGKGIIARTSDGGENWSKSEIEFQGDGGGLRAIHFAPDLQSGWAVGGEGRYIRNDGWAQWSDPLVLHTTDGGITWQRQQVNVRTPLIDVWAISGQEAWICSFGGYALPTYIPASLLHTTDGGQTWRDERPAGCSLRKLFFLDSTHGWAVGGQGGSPHEPARVIYVYQVASPLPQGTQ